MEIFSVRDKSVGRRFRNFCLPSSYETNYQIQSNLTFLKTLRFFLNFWIYMSILFGIVSFSLRYFLKKIRNSSRPWVYLLFCYQINSSSFFNWEIPWWRKGELAGGGIKRSGTRPLQVSYIVGICWVLHFNRIIWDDQSLIWAVVSAAARKSLPCPAEYWLFCPQSVEK